MGKNPFPVFHFNLKVPYSLGVFPGGAVVKNPPANAGEAGDVGSTPGWEDPREKEMATHILA